MNLLINHHLGYRFLRRHIRVISGCIFVLTAWFIIPYYSYAAGWDVKKSQHFIIYSHNEAGLAKKVIAKAEGYYYKITRDIGYVRYRNFWLWDNRVRIYIYKNRQEYIRRTGQPKWSGGYVSYKNRTIRTYKWSEHFLDSLLPHELTHIIFREFVGFREDIPFWLDEGIAIHEQEYKDKGYKRILKQALQKKRIISLEALGKIRVADESDSILVSLYYAQAASIVGYLIEEYGSYRFTELCRRLRDGESLKRAWKFVYSSSGGMKRWENKWLEHINRTLGQEP